MRADGNNQQPIDGGVAALLRTLRTEHPDAQITTDLVRLDETLAVVRAAIVLPGGGSASGYGASAAGGHESVEAAEIRALSRALAVLGYDAVEEWRPAADSVPAAPDAPEPIRVPVEQAAPESASVPDEPIERPKAEPVRPATRTIPAPTPTAAVASGDEPPLEDYSWTAFWNWARGLGYQNKTAVEELIGQSITSLSPAQVRNLLREKTGAE
jgi:hypothetical protein